MQYLHQLLDCLLHCVLAEKTLIRSIIWGKTTQETGSHYESFLIRTICDFDAEVSSIRLKELVINIKIDPPTLSDLHSTLLIELGRFWKKEMRRVSSFLL